jgi:hypothetical protein
MRACCTLEKRAARHKAPSINPAPGSANSSVYLFRVRVEENAAGFRFSLALSAVSSIVRAFTWKRRRTSQPEDAVSSRCTRPRRSTASQPSPKFRRFSVVSCLEKRTQKRLVASSISGINWQAGPRSSGHGTGSGALVMQDNYVIGVIATTVLWGVTLGGRGTAGVSFSQDMQRADPRHWLYAIVGGVIFNVANLLLVAAIEIAGMATAFPIGIGLALVVGVVLNYILSPMGSVLLLIPGVLLVVAAILLDARAYSLRESSNRRRPVRE